MLDNNPEKQQEEVPTKVIVKDILGIAGPALVTLLSFFLVEVITMIFTGHLGDGAILAGAGLGSMLMTIVGLAITCGMNSALTTLISQSHGQNNMRLCGFYYNQARIMVTLLFIPIMIIIANSDKIFLAFGFEPHICQYALSFALYKSPYLYVYSIYDATKRLLYNTGYQSVPMVIQVITTCIHPFWCYLFVDAFDMGLKGAALAQSVSHILNMVTLSIYLNRIESFKDAWYWPTAECFKGLGNYLKIGFFSMCMIWLNWCAFEFITLMSGYLDVASTGGQIVLYNFECLIFMPALAISIASGAMVGKQIGAGNVPLAKRYARVSQLICLVETIALIIFILIFKNLIAELYTNVESIEEKVEDALIIIAFGQLVNQTQSVLQGIVRGLGQVSSATLNELISYYGFAIPLAYIFGFQWGNGGQGLGLNGLWYGLFGGQLVLCIIYQYLITYKFNWDNIMRAQLERMDKDSKLIEMKDKEGESTPLKA